MNDNDISLDGKLLRPPWNKGKLIGPKPLLKAEPCLVDPNEATDGASDT